MTFEDRTFEDLLSELASDAPTPGGGTAAALAGAMGAALAEMVAALTLGKDKYASSHAAVGPIGQSARRARAELLRLAQEDSDAYDAVVAARRLPKATPEEQQARSRKITEANRLAADVPMRTARAAARLLELLPELAEKGNPNAASDAGAAALLVESAVQGALLNVAINVGGVGDDALAGELKSESERLGREASATRARVLEVVRSRF